ncbi:MAG TPA: aminotransferase class V-fold PLP-dependent enzyme [Casimicrobiaceae bacterium]|nr:aminotransferase class V-fold PLP-dependent enzyme [Casimicrobiaceae bacterium]
MEPLILAADARAVSEYMTSGGWLTEFQKTRLLEKSICEFTGARFCTMTPNGMLALFLALAACGISREDEVIVPTLTMAATATAVVLAGGRVIFADIDAGTLCLDLDRVERSISARTRAVVVVSLNGRAPKGLDEFVARCRSRGVKVIEDAAQSLGSFSNGRHLGTIGDCGCFSFSSHKVVTTGQGGAVVTDDESVFRKMRLLRDFGRLEGGTDHYLSVGWNLKFTDLQAVVGLEQMRRLPELLRRKKRIFDMYREHLAGVEGIDIPATGLESTTPLFADLLVDQRLKLPLIDYLHLHGVGSRSFYPALHSEPAFATGDSLPVAELVSSRGLWLPSSIRLEPEHVEQVCQLIRTFIAS